MQHDELRLANRCFACKSRKLIPCELLADNAPRCVRLIKDINPAASVVVWSDMFDPHHNALGDSYLVNGTLAESWKGLDRSVVIANGNAGKAKPSLDFFAGRGHSQIIARYYDEEDNFASWNAATRSVPLVEGFMYTTWVNRYDDLVRYARMITPKK